MTDHRVYGGYRVQGAVFAKCACGATLEGAVAIREHIDEHAGVLMTSRIDWVLRPEGETK